MTDTIRYRGLDSITDFGPLEEIIDVDGNHFVVAPNQTQQVVALGSAVIPANVKVDDSEQPARI